ncbi:MAG TPA: acetylglutamate kinase [Bacteroidota bacterium]
MTGKIIDFATKEEVLIEALPYIQTYEGKTFVIKYGGAAMTDEQLKQTFAKDVTLLRKIGINMVIVHGGGKEITDAAAKFGIETRFVNGQRYTDDQMVRVVLMVLAGAINKEIVHLINRNGGNAIGICGVDNGLLKARKLTANGVDLGSVGSIVSVNTSFLQMMLSNAMMPVIAPVAAGESEGILNVNADVAAAAVASALKAEKLVYLSDVEGILANGLLVSTLTETEAKRMVDRGDIFGGMIPKVQSAFETLAAGVNKVHIVDGRVKHSLLLEIFTDEGIGTQMVHDHSKKGKDGSS